MKRLLFLSVVLASVMFFGCGGGGNTENYVAPVANAGPDQNVITGSTVTLNGTGSRSLYGSALSYQWALTARPVGSAAVLSSTTAPAPEFMTDVDGSYIVSLRVSDGIMDSAQDTVLITATTGNAAPVANAGLDQNATTGSLVTLAGSGSDANGDSLTYSWQFISQPVLSSAVLSSATVSNPSFTADAAGTYVLSLTVNDGTADSAADTVMITADTASTPGLLDTGFGSLGYVVHNNAAGGNGHDYGLAGTIDSSGKILVAGSSRNAAGNSDMVIWRYNTGGTLDTAFNGTGYVVHNAAAGANNDDLGYAVTTDASGRILAAGRSRSLAGNNDMVIWRYNTDGTLDATFNGVGYVVHNSAAGGNSADVAVSIMTDASGKIIVAGASYNAAGNSDLAIWRYNTDGTLDTTFNGTGFVIHDNAAGGNSHDQGKSVTIDSGGNILVTGYSYNAAGNSEMVIWRYKTDGTLDTTFNGAGFVRHDGAAGGSGYDEGYSITVDSSGRILTTGMSSNAAGNWDMVIWRYNADGSLDTAFNGAGFTVHDGAAGGAGNDQGYSIAIDSSGRILVTGNSVNANYDMVVWRYNADGTLDTTFNGAGYSVHSGAAGGNDVDEGFSVKIDSSGKIVIAGRSYNAAGNSDMAIWRYE